MKIIKEDIKKQSITESINDGWEEIFDLQETDVIDNLEALIYELRNCVRGAYTKCTTYVGLGQYIKQLAEELDYLGDSITNMTDPDSLD